MTFIYHMIKVKVHLINKRKEITIISGIIRE